MQRIGPKGHFDKLAPLGLYNRAAVARLRDTVRTRPDSILIAGDLAACDALLCAIAAETPTFEQNLLVAAKSASLTATLARLLPHITCVDIQAAAAHGSDVWYLLRRADPDLFILGDLDTTQDLRQASVAVNTGHRVFATIDIPRGYTAHAWFAADANRLQALAAFEFLVTIAGPGARGCIMIEKREQVLTRCRQEGS